MTARIIQTAKVVREVKCVWCKAGVLSNGKECPVCGGSGTEYIALQAEDRIQVFIP